MNLSGRARTFARPLFKPMAPNNNLLDQPLLALSESDYADWKTVFEGTFIAGSPGAGKSTTSGRNLAYALMRRRDSGGLVLVAKGEETQKSGSTSPRR